MLEGESAVDEAMLTGKGLTGRARATGITAGLAGFVAAAALPPTRWLMEKLILPAPGEGPDADAQARGFFVLTPYLFSLPW